ncbi:MAG: hypothetical protein QW814_02950 [Methanothrix sp.]
MTDRKTVQKAVYWTIIFAMLAILAYSFLLQVHELAIKPSDIAQAGGARFYENFVYNSSNKIPNDCLVFSYDPTLFNIVGKASVQYYYVYNQSFMSTIGAEYKCLVLDYGYWCGTPDNICGQAFSEYKTSPIATATYPNDNFTYGFYRITGYNSS